MVSSALFLGYNEDRSSQLDKKTVIGMIKAGQNRFIVPAKDVKDEERTLETDGKEVWFTLVNHIDKFNRGFAFKCFLATTESVVPVQVEKAAS